MTELTFHGLCVALNGIRAFWTVFEGNVKIFSPQSSAFLLGVPLLSGKEAEEMVVGFRDASPRHVEQVVKIAPPGGARSSVQGARSMCDYGDDGDADDDYVHDDSMEKHEAKDRDISDGTM